MKIVIPFAALALAGCASAAPAPSPAPGAVTQAPARTAGHIQQRHNIAPGVDVLIQPTAFAGVVGNVTIIQQSDGVVLVDTGSSYGGGARVVAQVRAITDLPVKAVIITHWHNDHPLGLAAILDAWPNAEIIATDATRAAMEAGRLNVPREASDHYAQTRIGQLQQAIDGMRENTTNPELSERERAEWAIIVEETPQRFPDQAGTHLVLPTRTFTDRYVIADATNPVEALFLGRANTDGDAVIWLPRQRILIAGDIVVAPVPYMFSMYPSDHIATLQRIEAMAPRLIVPGHGPVLSDFAYLDKTIALIRDAQAQIAPHARASATLEEARAHTDFRTQISAFAGDDPWLAYWFENYTLAPLLDSVYREARGEPLGPPPIEAP